MAIDVTDKTCISWFSFVRCDTPKTFVHKCAKPKKELQKNYVQKTHK